MIDLQQLQILAQLVDNMDVLSERLEKAYASKDNSEFNKIKNEILNTQKNISQIVK